MQKTYFTREKFLKILKFPIKYFFSKCSHIYLSADWLISFDGILEGKLDEKY